MKRTAKAPAPASLPRFRSSPLGQPPTWENFDSQAGAQPKLDVRNALRTEQRGLCAYCERKLIAQPGQESVEHLHPKHKKHTVCITGRTQPDWGLAWDNLVAVCKKGLDGQSCDHTKDDQDLCGEILSPPTMPADPIFDLALDGALQVRAGVSPLLEAQARRSCDPDTLDLNRAELRRDRLREASAIRQNVLALQRSLALTMPAPTAAARASEMVAAATFPDGPHDLPEFYTAKRATLGAAAEMHLRTLAAPY